MCALCADHEIKINLFKRALSSLPDRLTIRRFEAALVDLQANPPQCTDVGASVVHLNLHRVNTALSELSISDLSDVVREIEARMPNPDDE